MKAPKESDILHLCLDWLRLKGALAIRVNSSAFGGEYKGRRRWVRSNDTPGCADILVCLPLADRAVFCAIEVKGPKGRLMPAQASFLDAVRAAGGLALCVRSLDELIAALRAEGFG